MLFNIDKSKMLHIGVGLRNLNRLLNIEGRPLEVYLKCGMQHENAAKAANKILEIIKRIFTYKSKDIVV